MAETHTTEEGQGGKALPEKLSQLRQKLGQKALEEIGWHLRAGDQAV